MLTTTIAKVEEFCDKWNVIELALFGSILRENFRDDSDVDVLVTFDPAARPTLLMIVRMRQELEACFGRPVDLLERGGMSSAPAAMQQSVL